MISVCLATYNGERFIKEQIESILPRLSARDEIIVSDANSDDATVQILENFGDQRIKILKSRKRLSPVFNFEKALFEASGDYIFLCDQDDVWNENKIERCLEYLKNYDCVVCDAVVADENLKTLQASFMESNKTRVSLFGNIFKNGYVGCCMAFRKSVLEKALPFPKDIPMHDMWIGSVAALFGRVYFLKEPLQLYRRHENAVSPTARKSPYSLARKIKFRINLCKNLFRLFLKIGRTNKVKRF